jgi:hypothetical protein
MPAPSASLRTDGRVSSPPEHGSCKLIMGGSVAAYWGAASAPTQRYRPRILPGAKHLAREMHAAPFCNASSAGSAGRPLQRRHTPGATGNLSWGSLDGTRSLRLADLNGPMDRKLTGPGWKLSSRARLSSRASFESGRRSRWCTTPPVHARALRVPDRTDARPRGRARARFACLAALRVPVARSRTAVHRISAKGESKENVVIHLLRAQPWPIPST